MATTMSDGVAALARKIAADQIAQDIDNNAKFALKADFPTTELIEQLIAFYNGYTGDTLDYRDYLDNSTSSALDSFYSFGDAYIAGAA
jgi:hypothetical protein